MNSEARAWLAKLISHDRGRITFPPRPGSPGGLRPAEAAAVFQGEFFHEIPDGPAGGAEPG